MENRFKSLARAFLETPPLWKKSQFGLEQFAMPDIDVDHLDEVHIPPKLRLGHKMERVFHALLSAKGHYEVIDRNVVVKRERRTLGEMDYLLRDTHNAQAIHLELTYKFYLIDPGISEPIYRLVGPNRRDMFYTKLDKLKEGQFALPFTEEGRLALIKRQLEPERLKQQVCFKAQLFRPYGSDRLGIRPLNPHCLAGTWMRLDDFQKSEFTEYTYYLPTKEEWASSPRDQVQWDSHYSVLIDLNLRMLKKSSALIWRRKKEGDHDKFFVVWW